MNTLKMPTLCAVAGPLPEAYRPFMNASGELQVGDAFGLEAQWLAGMILEQAETYQYPEDYWTAVQIQEDEQGAGCVRCGDEAIDTMRGLCNSCREC